MAGKDFSARRHGVQSMNDSFNDAGGISPQVAAMALGGECYGNNVLCPGPGSGPEKRNLSVTFEAGRFVVNSFAGVHWKECRDHVRARLGISDNRRPLKAIYVAPDHPWKLKRTDDALDIWNRSIPIAGTLAERYLASRKLTYEGSALRFFRGDRLMVALMTDAISGEPRGIHRTYLDANGNAFIGPDGKKVRRMLGSASGAIVRLSADDTVTMGLAIAEGIETSLAVIDAGHQPVWAALSASGIAKFPVLSGIQTLTIFADNDANGTGQREALKCAKRWLEAGREARVIAPRHLKDWNDVQKARGDQV